MLVGIIKEWGGGKKEICWAWAWQGKDQGFKRCQRHQQVSQSSLQSVDWRGACSKLATLVLIRYREEAWGVVRWRMPAKLVQLLGSLQLLHTFVVLGPSLSLTPGGFLSTETQWPSLAELALWIRIFRDRLMNIHELMSMVLWLRT